MSNIFPGFMIFSGSTVVLISFIRLIVFSPISVFNRSFFPTPMPCSPVQVPPSAMACSAILDAMSFASATSLG